MTREELDGYGDAIDRDELIARADAQIATDRHERQNRQTEQHGIGESIGYRCATEGCASDPAYPEHACPNCRAVAAIEQKQADEARVAEELASGAICVECGSPLTVQVHRPTRCTDCGGDGQVSPWYVAGQYFSEPKAAMLARARYLVKRNRLAARMQRLSLNTRRVPAREAVEAGKDARFSAEHEDALDERYTEIWGD